MKRQQLQLKRPQKLSAFITRSRKTHTTLSVLCLDMYEINIPPENANGLAIKN